MKIRNIPFGYALENGEIVLHGQEAQAVKEIFLRYLQGSSLQAVADIMDIPYSAASPDWSKHKVKRVLDNPRYTGLNNYPALVSAGDYTAAQRLKAEKNTSIPATVSADIELLRPLTYCQICGNRLRRKIHPYGERWRCHPECENTVSLRDGDLLRAVTDALNAIIQAPDMLRTSSSPRPASLSVTKLQNELNREMDKANADADSIQHLLFALAAEKYAACDDDSQIIMLREAFQTHNPINQFDSALFKNTVDKALISNDGTASLLLKNGQTLPTLQKQEGSHTDVNANADAS